MASQPPTATVWCQRPITTLTDVRGLYLAAATVFPTATHRGLQQVKVRPLAPTHPARGLLAVERDGLRLYWKAGVAGATLWHELVHAGQHTISASERDVLIDHLRTLDRQGKVPDNVMRGAFASALVVLERTIPKDLRDPARLAYLRAARDLHARLETPTYGAPFAMRDEILALTRAMQRDPAWAVAYPVLSKEYDARGDWRRGLERLLWLEVHAYWSGDACEAGSAWWWPRVTPPARP